MKTLKIGFGSVLAVALLFSSMSEAAWWNAFEENVVEGQELEAQMFERGEGKQNMRGRMKMPDGERGMGRFFKQGEMPERDGMEERMQRRERPMPVLEESEDMDDMEEDHKEGFFERMFDREDRGEPGERLKESLEEAGIEVPENWSELSPEEHRAFFEENNIEMPKPKGEDMERGQGRDNEGQQMSRDKQMRNFMRKAEKGKHFKKFTGQLRPRKQFKDEGEMRNPEAAQFMQQRGIMEGYEDGTFGADKPINRAESLKVLLESLGIDPAEVDESKFEDVDIDAWYAGYVEEGRRRGFVKGYDDGTFKPGKTVNQAELLKISFESFGIDLSDYEITGLPEGVDEAAWFAPYLQYALDNDLLDEEDVNLGEGMNREMFAEVISRLIQQQEAFEE